MCEIQKKRVNICLRGFLGTSNSKTCEVYLEVTEGALDGGLGEVVELDDGV